MVLVLGCGCTHCRSPDSADLHARLREPFLWRSRRRRAKRRSAGAREYGAFGIPKHIVGFVFPTGYSFNLDGSALYLSLASVFVAQAAHAHLSLSQQIIMMLTLMLTSKGVAAVPRAALVILAGTIGTFHLPMEGVALLLGVDALMDMCRTSVNLLGNCVATAVVARWEGVRIAVAGDVELTTLAS